MSEPIMVVSENMMGESNHTVTESSSSGPGPPKRIPLTLQRKIVPIDSELPEIPILFVLGINIFNLKITNAYIASIYHSYQSLMQRVD